LYSPRQGTVNNDTNMAAAYWMANGFRALLPIVSQGEPAALYCSVFFYIAAQGSSGNLRRTPA